jgi:dTDP-4-amino-4,6-dideoxygalactose transaminase
MPVHWCGRIANMDEINAIADRHGLVVIEDSAQCMGAYWKGQHGGTFGKIGAISTHPLKNLNALGDGGFLLTDDDEIDRKVRLYRNHGLESRDDCVMYGVNSRLDILNAEVLKYRLTRLEDVIARREKNVNQYRELITAEQVFIPADKPEERNAWVMFLIQAADRDGLQAHLSENGVQSLIYYGTPLHLHKAAEQWGRYKRGDMPVAEAHCDRVLALPHHQCLTEDQVSYVADQVNAFYA